MLVLFDLDGTLLDLSLLAEVLRESVSRSIAKDLGCTEEDVRTELAAAQTALSNEDRKVAFFSTKVYPDEDPLIHLNQAAVRVHPSADVIGTYARVRVSCACPPYPDAIPTLSALREAGHTIGVCTNTVRHMAVSELVDSGINTCVDLLVAGDDPQRPFKGDPVRYRARLNELAQEHGSVMAVGDVASLDLEPAHAEGCRTCLITRPYTPQRSRVLEWIDQVVGSLAEILPLFEDH